MVKIRKEVIAYADYPVIVFKDGLTREEYNTYSKLIDSDKCNWGRYIEDYEYLSSKAISDTVMD